MILKDYKCPAHGYFESDTAVCFVDNCEANVMRVHLRAPGIKSERTKGIDTKAKQLAMDYKMTNIKTAKEGESLVNTVCFLLDRLSLQLRPTTLGVVGVHPRCIG